MTTHDEFSKKKTHSIEFQEELQKFNSNLDNYTWKGEVPPVLTDSDRYIALLDEKLTAYKDIQISESQVLITNESFFIWGNKVKGTLLASMISREYEQRRHLIGSVWKKDQDPKLMPIEKIGFGFHHRDVHQIQALTFGDRYSVYFFTSEEQPHFRINDITGLELEVLKEIYNSHGVELEVDEFSLPLRDMCLLFAIGCVLLILGWIIIALIFP